MRLTKNYSKECHLNLLPCGDNNILENIHFLYDENWENQGASYPYEILTYLFDSYYVLPQRPDLAALFCWQAINHSYYVQQLSDNSVGFCLDTKGVEFVRGAILANWNNKYKAILEPFLERLPDKTFHYVASYMLKGYAMEKKGKISLLSEILSSSKRCQATLNFPTLTQKSDIQVRIGHIGSI